MKNHLFFILFFLFTATITSAQLEWLVEPIIDHDKFIYDPDQTKALIVVIEADGKKGVLKKNGEYLFRPGTFSQLHSIPGNGVFYGLTVDNKNISFNSQGKIISDGYDRLNAYYNTNIILTERNHLFGLIDTLGTPIREPIYKNLKRIKRGLYQGDTPDSIKEMIKVEETDGLSPKQRATNFGILSSKIKDRIIIIAPSKKKGYYYYGFTNMKGDTILAPNRYYSNFLSMGYESQVMIALDSETEKEGLFDKDANILVPFEYDKIWRGVIADQYIIANKGSNYSIITVDGQVKATIKADKMFPMRNQLFVKAEIDKKTYLLFPDLTLVIEEGFDSVQDPFEKDFTIVAKNKLKGFYSFKTGKYTEPQFKQFKMPALDKFAVSKGQYFGLFDVHTGEFVTDTIFANIQKHGKYYIATTEQKDSVLKDSVYQQRIRRSYTLYDSTLKVVYGPTQHSLNRVAKDIFKETINRDSIIIHNFHTGAKQHFFNKRLQFMEDNIVNIDKENYCFIDELFVPGHKSYEYLSSTTENIRIFKQNGKYGILYKRKIVHEALFDQISTINDGMIKVKLNGKWGVLSNPYDR